MNKIVGEEAVQVLASGIWYVYLVLVQVLEHVSKRQKPQTAVEHAKNMYCVKNTYSEDAADLYKYKYNTSTTRDYEFIEKQMSRLEQRRMHKNTIKLCAEKKLTEKIKSGIRSL